VAKKLETPQVGEHAREILEAMAGYYDEVRVSFANFTERTRWEAVAGCPQETELAQLARQYGPGVYWDGSDVRLAVSITSLFLHVMEQYLAGITVLLRSHEVVFPLAPLVRSTLEIGGRVAWMLDPRVYGRDRSARIFLVRLENLTRAKTTAISLGELQTASKRGQALHKLRKITLVEHYYPSEIKCLNSGELVLRKQRLVGLSAGMRYLDEVHWKNPSSGGMYDYLSDASHPTFHTAMEMIQEGSVGASGEHSTPTYSIGLETVIYPYRLARAAAVTFLDTWLLLADYLGQEASDAKAIGTRIDELPKP
jgi:hypothetical protein